jgi:hypothetical protein
VLAVLFPTTSSSRRHSGEARISVLALAVALAFALAVVVAPLVVIPQESASVFAVDCS